MESQPQNPEFRTITEIFHPCSWSYLSSYLSVGQSVLLVTQANFHFLTEGVHAWHNDCLWYVDDKEGFRKWI